MNKKLVTACAIGSALEWFDYTLYGTFATTISKLFFAAENQAVSLMWTYLIFAFGFFSRPLGGIIFGHIGDKISRKKALILSILVMSVPTFATGLLPAYEKIGIWAPIFLALIRLLQGIAIGGEFTGSMVFLVESAPAKKRGIYGCWSDVGSPCGVLLGVLVSLLLSSTMNIEDFEAYGWRLPFLSGIVIAFFGAYLRYGIDDTGDAVTPEKQATIPLIETIKNHKKTIINIVFINAFGGCLFYILNTFLHNYFKATGMLASNQALCVTSIVSMFTTIAIPIGGVLSDKFGRKKIMLISVYCFLLCAVPMFATLKSHLMYTHLVCESLVGFCNGMFWGGRAAFYSETFPRHLRCTAVALAFGISHSLFAGTTPFVAEFLITQTGTHYSICAFLVILAILAIYSLRELKDRTAKELL